MQRRETATYTFGRFQLDAAERRLSRDGQAIPLTPKAFDTLLTLVQHSGHALSKDELMRAVWPDGFVEEVNLAYNISILRKALSAADGGSGERYIETVPKLGYRFIAPVQASPSPAGEGRGGVRTNLPAQLTRFIGREREIEQMVGMLGMYRLITLTGSGGVGKSRLALKVASRFVGATDSVAPTTTTAGYPDGVWLAELAPLSDAVLVPPAVAAALGLIEASGRSALDVLQEFLRTKKALLILDNCEHLVVACAQLADALLRSCPDLTILATSREPLGVDGEAIYRVPSLAFPNSNTLPPVEEMIAFDAVRLFVDRAAMTASGFEVTPRNVAAVAEVCRRLDGIPLAIELAAARSNALSAEQIAERLDDRFGLLISGSHTTSPRHKTLRAVIDWSFDLLTPEERDLLARLSVFAGGFTAEAAEAVADQPGMLDLLAKLVDKSLVVADVRSEAARYRMLETIRQYAHDKLMKCGDLERTRDRQLEYFRQLAERAEPELRQADQIMWLDRLEGELSNLRAVLGWALDGDRHVEAGLRLATTLLWFWHARDHKREGSDWLQRALAAEERTRGAVPLSPSRGLARAGALNAASLLMGMHRQLAEFKALAEEALMLARGLGEPGKRNVAFALCHLAAAASMQQKADQARALSEESLALYQEIGDQFGMAQCCGLLGSAILTTGDFERARAMYEWDVALRQEIGDKDGLVDALGKLGGIVFLQGDLDRATAIYEEVLALNDKIGHKWATGLTLSELAKVALVRGEYEQAVTFAKREMALGEGIGDKNSVADSHLNLSKIALARGQYDRSASHAECALGLFREIGYPSALAKANYLLGIAALAQSRHEQAAQRFDEALKLAREIGGKFVIARALFGLGQAAQVRQDYHLARSLHQEALALRRGSHLRHTVAASLDALACVAAAQGQAGRAARLFGAGAKLYELIRWTQSPFERELHERGIAAAHATLSDAEFEAAYAAGQRMTLDEAVEYALADTASDASASRSVKPRATAT